MPVACVAVLLQLVTGHMSGQQVGKYQPAKMAAFEGLYETQKGAPLGVIGYVDTKEQKVHGLEVPYMLSFFLHNDFNAEVIGLDQFPKNDWPNVAAVYQTYHLMIAMWGLMFITMVFAVYLWCRGTLFESRWMLRWIVLSVAFPQIGNQVGWVSAEMGRYPWIVQGLLRISDGLSKSVQAHQVLGSIIMFGIVYLALFILFIYLLNEKFQYGPTEADMSSPYHTIGKWS